MKVSTGQDVMTIRELAETLSPEERERHKDLLAGYQAREEELDAIAADCEGKLAELTDSVSERLIGVLTVISEKVRANVQATKGALSNLRQRILSEKKPVGLA